MPATQLENERQRLEALHRYRILDTPPEEIFDQLTHLASTLCAAPIALISLLDTDRQWFKSKVGLAMTETPRDVAFCRHAVLQDDLLVVRDATKDARFATNPLVMASPYIRFYAGAPLVTSDGFTLGCLCILDYQPRTLNLEQQKILKTLAQQVIKQIEKRQQPSLQPVLSSFQLLFEQNPRPMWIFDRKTLQFLAVNQAAIAHYGYSQEEFLGMRIIDIRPPEDVEPLVKRLAQEGPGLVSAGQWRHCRKDGQVIDVGITSHSLEFAGRQAELVVVEDITEQKRIERALRESEARFRSIVEAIPVPIVIARRVDGLILYANSYLGETFGLPFEAMIGRKTTDFYTDPAERQRLMDTLDQQGYVYGQEVEAKKVDGTHFWVSVSIQPFTFEEESTIFVAFLDITQRKQVEATLRQQGELLQTIFDHIPVMVALFDPQGQFQWVSREWEQVLGWTLAEIQTHDVLAEFYPDPEYRRSVIHFIQKSERVWQDFRMRLRNGTVLETSWANIRLSDGSTIGIGQDITERKRIETALQQRIERERLIAGITQRMRQSLSLMDILNTTVAEVRQFLQTDRVFIYRFHADWSGSVAVESVADSWISIAGMSNQVPLDTPLIELLEQGQIQVIENLDAARSEFFYWHLLKGLQVKASLIAPILQGEHLWGTLVVHHCREPRHWQSWEMSLLQHLANQAAVAIQQSDLYDQVKQFNADLEDEVQERTYQLQQALVFDELLKRITDRVRDSLDEDNILQTAVQELALGLATEGCDTGIYNSDYTTCTISHEYVVSMSPAKGMVISVAENLDIHRQLLSGQYLQFCWLSSSPRGVEKKFAILACPILDDQGVLGNLWLFKRNQEWFNDLELRLVQQVANQCAIAIRQARLYQIAQRQVDELEKLHQLKDEFLSTVSHELRTPITNISMAIHMLQLAPTPERQEQYLNILQAECKRETQLINDLLDLQRLEANRYDFKLEPIHFQDWLPGLITPFVTRTQERQQQLQVNWPTDLPSLISDKASLERMLNELLNNACKYTPSNGRIVLDVNITPISDTTETVMFHFSIRNTATIPTAELPLIFDKFYRIPNADPWKQGGTGLGLALVKNLVDQLQGTVQVNSDNGWTTFTVSLKSMINAK